MNAKKIWIVYALETCLLTVGVLPSESWAGIVMWNKLGSTSEVVNSEIGLDGALVGSLYAFELAQHGDGYVRKDTSSYVQFPNSMLMDLSYRGTVEMWINPKVPNPVPYQYGFFALLGESNAVYPAQRGNVWLMWGDGVTGTGLYGGVVFDGSLAQTPSESQQFVATPGTPFHAAICWDIDGIDGSGDTVRVYRDGVVVGSTSAAWNPDGTLDQDRFKLGQGPDAQAYDKFITDNIKVWDFAETDFSHRFQEDWIPEPSSIVMLVVASGLLAARRRR